MGVESPFYSPRALTFARAQAYKYMIPVWGHSWLEFSALTDGSLQDVHYQQSLAQFAATGGATGPRATCVAGSPSTLPFSHLAPRCHRVTRDATGFQLEIPIFARTRLSPLTLAVAHARLRERASGLSRCSTDHRGGPRIMRQDLWALQGHGQCDPLQTPAQVLVEKSHATSYYYIVCFLRFWRAISYNSDEAYDMYVRYRIIATRSCISYTTSYFFIRYRIRRRI
jgi:hypothetical protein